MMIKMDALKEQTYPLTSGIKYIKRSPSEFYRRGSNFLQNKIDKLLSKSRIRQTSPPRSMREIHIDIVNGCQLKCVGCPNSTISRKIEFMPLESFERCLKNIDVFHIKLLTLFNFGEPLLHPELPELLKLIPGQSWTTDTVEISTNAQYLNKKTLMEAFKTGVLSKLVASCDGDGTPEEYERLRPPGKWDKLLLFLSTAREMRDKYSPGTKLMTRTCCEDESGKKRWRELLAPLGWEPEFRNFMILPKAVENPTGRKPVIRGGACYWMEAGRLYVNGEGMVVPCCAHPEAFILGDLKVEKYSRIFCGETRKLFLNKLMHREELSICGECEF